MNEHSFIFAAEMRARDIHKETAIRERALKMFVREGFAGFSMQKLAREAGVSPATIYIYFKDKEDLITQLCAEESEKMTSYTLQGFDPLMPFNEGMRVQWMNRARYCMENQDAMLFLEQMRNSPLSETSFKVINERFKTIMSEFVNNAIARNELIEVPVEVFWSVAYAPLYNLVKFHVAGTSIGGRPFKFSQDLMDQTLEIVLKALKP